MNKHSGKKASESHGQWIALSLGRRPQHALIINFKCPLIELSIEQSLSCFHNKSNRWVCMKVFMVKASYTGSRYHRYRTKQQEINFVSLSSRVSSAFIRSHNQPSKSTSHYYQSYNHRYNRRHIRQLSF